MRQKTQDNNTSIPLNYHYDTFLFLSYKSEHIPWSGKLSLSLSVSKDDCGIRFLEHVQVQMNLTFPRRGYLEMWSVSPSKTKSELLYPRVIDSITGYKNLSNWTVTSLHYWGENPVGNWYITIRNTKPHRSTRSAHGNVTRGDCLCNLHFYHFKHKQRFDW